MEYSVHPELLSQHSEYFGRALNGNWKEAEERVITLVDVDCGICQYWIKDRGGLHLPFDS